MHWLSMSSLYSLVEVPLLPATEQCPQSSEDTHEEDDSSSKSHIDENDDTLSERV